MSRITKQIAEDIAVKLCSKKKTLLDESNKKLSFFITDVAKRKVPKEVSIAFSKMPSYIKTRSCPYVQGQGISGYPSVSLTESVPMDSDSIQLNAKEAEKYLSLKAVCIENKKTYEGLLKEVENALLNCRTYNKVKELFPEAATYLPPVYDPPALNLIEIRKKIK